VLGVAVARALEQGAIDGAVARWMERAWGRAAACSLAHHLVCPPHVRTVAVGGATLGGSGKTPLAMAMAAHLALFGARVALVGHGYRAGLRKARFVTAGDRVADVGDEALLAARALSPGGVRVVVGRRRAAAVELAASWADVVVFDGVCQTRPCPATFAVLAVDANEPWGHAVAGPPRGDLVAPREALLAACDAVVSVGRPLPAGRPAPPLRGGGPGRGLARPIFSATPHARGAWLDEVTHTRPRSLLTWAELRTLRVGLVTAIARPVRVIRDLSTHGVAPCVHVRARDHGPIDAATARACRAAAVRWRLDAWLATPKCALHVASVPTATSVRDGSEPLGAPVATLEHSIVLPTALCARLLSVVSRVASSSPSSLLDPGRREQ